ncbi:MAG: hypothetical protein Roseis2KO_17130 [Roseivirga sp.]
MSLTENTVYEESIDDLLRARTEKEISDGLRWLFSSYWNEEDQVVASEIETFCKTGPTPIRGKEEITQSKLKNYVGNQLLLRLKREDREEKAFLTDRCEVILKFLKDVYKTKELSKSAISFVNSGIIRIREESNFPSLGPNKSVSVGAATKYRALANLLKGEVESGEKSTLKLAIAIFGIDITQFDKFLEDLKSEDSPPTNAKDEVEIQKQTPQQPVEPQDQDWVQTAPEPKEPVLDNPASQASTFAQWLSASKYRKTWILILGSALFSVTSFFGYEYFSKLRLKGQGLRPTIKASELFGRQFKLNPDDFDISDSLLVLTDTVFTEDLLMGSDTVALGKLIIKLRMVNLMTDKTYFPDAVYLKSDTWGTLSGKAISTGSRLNVDANLKMMLDAEQTWPYEWTVTSGPSDKGLPPLTEQHTLLEISGNKNMEQVLVPFMLIFKLHEVSNPGNTLLINSDRPYRIAFR